MCTKQNGKQRFIVWLCIIKVLTCGFASAIHVSSNTRKRDLWFLRVVFTLMKMSCSWVSFLKLWNLLFLFTLSFTGLGRISPLKVFLELSDWTDLALLWYLSIKSSRFAFGFKLSLFFDAKKSGSTGRPCCWSIFPDLKMDTISYQNKFTQKMVPTTKVTFAALRRESRMSPMDDIPTSCHQKCSPEFHMQWSIAGTLAPKTHSHAYSVPIYI